MAKALASVTSALSFFSLYINASSPSLEVVCTAGLSRLSGYPGQLSEVTCCRPCSSRLCRRLHIMGDSTPRMYSHVRGSRR
uniref:Putative secreted protein n=1 Tax=Ixodes ricinus TaxID=34613 RepID=A0A6B0U647_IXORI